MIRLHYNMECRIMNVFILNKLLELARLLGRFAAEHNHTPNALRLVCGLYFLHLYY